MAIDIGNPIPPSDEGKGTVFGTFPDGSIYYDPTEFERKRSDGTTVIDMVPDCRVFIYGSELSKDVVSVSTNNALGGNTCNIKLSNPNGKYEISKRDLVGKWREDKDILSTYGYDWLKRLTPDKPDILGYFLSNDTKSVIDSLMDPNSKEWWDRTLGSAGWPSIFNATRMMFEIKHFSGITKRSGDIIFDYRDPVMVFMKGRFSPYWYFAFTGIVSSWDDTDTYDQEMSITLRCEDPLAFLKRHRFTKQGSLLNFGNIETMSRNTSKSQATNIWETVFGGMIQGQDTTLDRAIKYVMYGTDNAANVINCHPRFSSRVDYDQKKLDQHGMRKQLSEDFKIGKPGSSGYVQYQDESDFMFTLTNNPDYSQTGYQGFTGAEEATQRWTNLVDIQEIAEIQEYGLNKDRPLATALPLYAQYNGILMEEFTGNNLTRYYNESVRYWEVRPAILEETPTKEYSGWDDGKAIGIAGIHPALTYKFINYFEMLPHVWKDCWNRRSSDKTVLDRLVVSPHEKIREIVSGSPTEDDALNPGNNMNAFRPRLFVVLPRKFLDNNRSIVGTGIGNLQLFNAEQTRSYDALKEICEAVEFSLYSSPAGDIFIEPEMYDFHPTEFVLVKDPAAASNHYVKSVGQIEPRNIILKKEEVEFRTVNSEEFGEENQNRKDSAYFFNPDANHPFFLMEKDRIRCSQTFKPENIVTHVAVMGSPTGKGGVGDAITVKRAFNQQMGRLPSQSGNQEANQFGEKYYIADGLTSQIRRGVYLTGDGTAVDEKIKKLRRDFNDSIYQKLVETHFNSSMLSFFEDAGGAALVLADKKYDINDNMVIDSNLVELLKTLREKSDQGQINNDVILVDQTSPVKVPEYIFQTVTLLAPKLVKYLQEYANVREQDRAFKSKYSPTWSKLIAVEVGSIIKYFFGSREEATVASLYNLSTNTFNSASTVLDRMKIEIKRSLLQMYLPLALQNADMRRAYEEIAQLQAGKGTTKYEAIDIMTLGDLKELEQLGLYNPSNDMVRYYGYNPGPTITNLMIFNDSEAQRYARTWFNKLFGRAHQIHMEIIGRPEMLLNRPYYCERKDAIGLLQNYSINFAIDSDFQSSLDLIYIRKNSITYDYTEDALDDIQGARTNTDFKNAAVAYYNSLADRFNLVQKGLSAIGKQAGRAVGGEIGGTVGEQLLNYEGKGYSGALFTAHNWIGHIEFDRVGREDPVVRRAVKKAELTDPKQQIFIGKLESKDTLATSKLIKYMTHIKRYLKELSELETKLKKLTEDINNDEDAKNLDALYKAGVRQSNQTRLEYQILSKLATFDKLKEEHTYLCKHIYGYGEYVGGEGEEVRKPTKTDLEKAYDYYYNNKNVDKKALYYRFIDEVVNGLGIPLKRIKLLDDRVVGVDTVDTAYAIKTGYDETLPLYMEPIDKDWTTLLIDE